MPVAMQERVKKALLDLNPADAVQAEILRLNRATRYVPTSPANYKGLEAAARSAGLL
jgi:phosphonate transport system substrate-binding protein